MRSSSVVLPWRRRRCGEGRGLRRRDRGRSLCWVADDFRIDGTCDRRHQPPRTGGRISQKRCSILCRRRTPSRTSSVRSGRRSSSHMLGPMLLRIDLKKACKEYEELHGAKRALGGLGDAWRAYEVRAFKIAADSQVVGKTVEQVEGMFSSRGAYVRAARAPRRHTPRRDRAIRSSRPATWRRWSDRARRLSAW